MLIITPDDVIARQTTSKLKDILDLSDSDNLKNDSRFLTAVSDANSMAAGYVRAAYPGFPFNVIPDVLKRYTSILTVWNLLDYKESNKSEKDNLQHQEAMEFFTNLDKKNFDLEYFSKVESNETLPATNVEWVVNNDTNLSRALKDL